MVTTFFNVKYIESGTTKTDKKVVGLYDLSSRTIVSDLDQ